MLSSFALLAVLACPIVMGGMMWMMMRGKDAPQSSVSVTKQVELTALQAQIDQLQAEQRDSQRSGTEGR